jgi:hypothetical protein
MKTYFKPAHLAASIALALGAATTLPAYAVNLSDSGLGEVILSPYYTVRNGYDTYIHVVNTSPDRVVAFKIRFRESDNSRDARDFNVFLSPNDVWTAAVTMSADGVTPVVQTGDNSCTAPALRSADATFEGLRGVKFTNLDYTGAQDDSGDNDIERTTDGHFEIIAMGTADPTIDRGDDPDLPAAAVHDPATGVPEDCGLIVSTYITDPGLFNDQFDEPLNVLKGSAALIKVSEGKAIGIPVTTLANFYNPRGNEDPANPDPQDLMNLPASINPNLSDAFPPVAVMVTNEFGPITPSFGRAIDAVSAIFMADDVINEYAIGGGGNAETDWVLTFPTKSYYVDWREIGVDASVIPPFENTWQEDLDEDGASCVTVQYDYYDREENRTDDPGDLDFSPAPPGIPPSSICEETVVLSFADDSVLDGNNLYGVPLASTFTSGWMRLSFTGAGDLAGTGYTFTGLPVIGFSIKTLENGVAGDAMLNYGIQADHAYNRVIDVD